LTEHEAGAAAQWKLSVMLSLTAVTGLEWPDVLAHLEASAWN